MLNPPDFNVWRERWQGKRCRWRERGDGAAWGDDGGPLCGPILVVRVSYRISCKLPFVSTYLMLGMWRQAFLPASRTTCARKGLVRCLDCPIVKFEPYGHEIAAKDNVRKGMPLLTRLLHSNYVVSVMTKARGYKEHGCMCCGACGYNW